MLWVVYFRFRDNNGKTAETKMRLPEALSFAAASSRALSHAALFTRVSSAELYELEIGREQPGPAGSIALVLSDVARTAVLFYRNGEDTASVRIPSITQELFEENGPYAGGRITVNSADAAELLDVLNTMMSGAIDPALRPYGELFIVGGLDRL